MLKLTGLWEKQGQRGKILVGKLNGLEVVIYENDRKTKDNQPDWNMYLKEPPKRDGDQGGQRGGGGDSRSNYQRGSDRGGGRGSSSGGSWDGEGIPF